MRKKAAVVCAPDPVELPPDVLMDVESMVRRNKDEMPAALKRLRTRAGLTRLQVGKLFKRSPHAVSKWETGQRDCPAGMTAALLEALSIPKVVIDEYLTTSNETGMQLNAACYANHDAVIVENRWFRQKRGPVLESVYERAVSGSDPAAKLFFERLDDNDEQFSSRQGPPERVINATALAWIEDSLGRKGPRATDKTTAIEKAKGVDTEGIDDVGGRQDGGSGEGTPGHVTRKKGGGVVQPREAF